IPVPPKRRKGNGKQLVIRGARANNLKDIDVAIPLGTFVAVSGVSGSGKSSLVTDILSRKVAQYFYRAKDKPGPHRLVGGLEHLDKQIDIDHSRIAPRAGKGGSTSPTPPSAARRAQPRRPTRAFSRTGGRCPRACPRPRCAATK